MTTETRTVARLRRVLDLASFLMSRPGVSLDEVADVLEIPRAEIVEDLDMLFLCGLPPYTPSDLFEVTIEGDRIWLTGAEPLEKPFGMSRYHAIRAAAAARLLLASPGADVTPELSTAAEKLEKSLGEEPLVAQVEEDEVALTLRQALAEGRPVELRYLSAGRGEETTRVVDPRGLVSAGGHLYLAGWCRRAEGNRTFRLDRIRTLEVLQGTPDDSRADSTALDFGYSPAEDDLRATFELDPDAAWVAQSIPIEDVETISDGGTRVVVASPDREFLVQLAMRLAGSLRKVEPAWLRNDLRQRADGLLGLQEQATRLGG